MSYYFLPYLTRFWGTWCKREPPSSTYLGWQASEPNSCKPTWSENGCNTHQWVAESLPWTAHWLVMSVKACSEAMPHSLMTMRMALRTNEWCSIGCIHYIIFIIFVFLKCYSDDALMTSKMLGNILSYLNCVWDKHVISVSCVTVKGIMPL
jgi:hypothetical protein